MHAQNAAAAAAGASVCTSDSRHSRLPFSLLDLQLTMNIVLPAISLTNFDLHLLFPGIFIA